MGLMDNELKNEKRSDEREAAEKKYKEYKEKNENRKYLMNVTIKFREPTKEERPAT